MLKFNEFVSRFVLEKKNEDIEEILIEIRKITTAFKIEGRLKNKIKIYFSDRKSGSDDIKTLLSRLNIEHFDKVMSGSTFPQTLFSLDGIDYQITYKPIITSTTNVKEGLVIAFFKSNINYKPDQSNIETVIEELRSILEKIPNESLDKKSKNEIQTYLDSFPLDKSSISELVDFWSTGFLIKQQLGGNDLFVSRTGIFDSIRTLASKLTKYPSDKWCPGDIYLIDPEIYPKLDGYVKELSLNIQDDTIQKLNLLFSHEMNINTEIRKENPLFGSIIAISLKKEQAQAGKAKQFLKTISSEEKDYNSTKEELQMDEIEMIESIEKYRKNIEISCNKSEITVNLIQDKNFTGGGNIEKIRQKFTTLKLVNKLLDDPKKIDENLLRAAAFGMSLTGINPTFFKIVGSSKGVAYSEKFPAGEMIVLLDGGLGNPDSIIEIKDLNSNTMIIFKFRIQKGEGDPKEIQFEARPNGKGQATLEIKKLK